VNPTLTSRDVAWRPRITILRNPDAPVWTADIDEARSQHLWN
jgi:hypothetical protein